MRPEYKNTDLLKCYPFYTSEIKITTKKPRLNITISPKKD